MMRVPNELALQPAGVCPGDGGGGEASTAAGGGGDGDGDASAVDDGGGDGDGESSTTAGGDGDGDGEASTVADGGGDGDGEASAATGGGGDGSAHKPQNFWHLRATSPPDRHFCGVPFFLHQSALDMSAQLASPPPLVPPPAGEGLAGGGGLLQRSHVFWHCSATLPPDAHLLGDAFFLHQSLEFTSRQLASKAEKVPVAGGGGVGGADPPSQIARSTHDAYTTGPSPAFQIILNVAGPRQVVASGSVTRSVRKQRDGSSLHVSVGHWPSECARSAAPKPPTSPRSSALAAISAHGAPWQRTSDWK